jgi:hypothetical protein
MLRARVLAGLDRVRQQGKKLGRPKVAPKGSAQGRERHQDASERRGRHPQGGGAGRLREWHGAAGEEGDGGRVGRGGVTYTPARPSGATGERTMAISVW